MSTKGFRASSTTADGKQNCVCLVLEGGFQCGLNRRRVKEGKKVPWAGELNLAWERSWFDRYVIRVLTSVPWYYLSSIKMASWDCYHSWLLNLSLRILEYKMENWSHYVLEILVIVYMNPIRLSISSVEPTETSFGLCKSNEYWLLFTIAWKRIPRSPRYLRGLRKRTALVSGRSRIFEKAQSLLRPMNCGTHDCGFGCCKFIRVTEWEGSRIIWGYKKQ